MTSLSIVVDCKEWAKAAKSLDSALSMSCTCRTGRSNPGRLDSAVYHVDQDETPSDIFSASDLLQSQNDPSHH